MERCGLIGAVDAVGVSVYPVPNVASTPATRFAMDPRAQVSAMARIGERGETLYAIYHSHPAGPLAPSATDMAEAHYPELGYLVAAPASTTGFNVAAFRLAGAGFQPAQMLVIDGAFRRR